MRICLMRASFLLMRESVSLEKSRWRQGLIPGIVRGVVRTCQLDRLPGIKFGWHDCMLLSRRIHRNGWHLLHIPLNKMIMSISSNKMTE